MDPVCPDVHVQLTGCDGNAMSIITAVRRALKDAGEKQLADSFLTDALASDSYAQLLRLCDRTVTVH